MADEFETVDRIRSFNRFYTQQIGLVDRSYLGSGLGLSEVRVLYELAQPEPPAARQLANDLGLDEGYVSRILAKFTKAGWVARQPDPADRRRTLLRLTHAGQQLAKTHTDQSRQALCDMLQGTSPPDQHRLTEAMHTIERILTGADAAVTLRDLTVGDIGWLIQQHGELYHAEEGFDHTFEALVAEILAEFVRNRDPLNERAFIAQRNGQRLGSVFCVRQSDEIAKLRLFLLTPDARGLGLGRKLLEACMAFARARGYRRMVLWTHKSHRTACALYEKYGFQMTSEEPVHEFGVDLVRQNWEIDL